MTMPVNYDLPRYDIHAATREFVAGITVAQFDESPAASYKLSLRPFNSALSNPDSAPDDWHDPDTKYGVLGLWVGVGGTVLPGRGVYLLAEAQLVDGIWSQARDIGVIQVLGDAGSGSAAVGQGAFRILQGPAPDDLDLPKGVVHIYINDDGTVSIATGDYS